MKLLNKIRGYKYCKVIVTITKGAVYSNYGEKLCQFTTKEDGGRVEKTIYDAGYGNYIKKIKRIDDTKLLVIVKINFNPKSED